MWNATFLEIGSSLLVHLRTFSLFFPVKYNSIINGLSKSFLFTSLFL